MSGNYTLQKRFKVLCMRSLAPSGNHCTQAAPVCYTQQWDSATSTTSR